MLWDHLNTAQKTECFALVADFFDATRRSSPSGLFQVWTPFVPAMSGFFRILTKQLDDCNMPVELVFQRLQALYGPWIVIKKPDMASPKPLLPWNMSSSEIEAAKALVHTLVSTILELPHARSQVLNQVWGCYTGFWSNVPVQHVLEVIHMKFSALDWENLQLSRTVLSAMQRYVDVDLALYAPFCAHVLHKIDLKRASAAWESEIINTVALPELLQLLFTMGRNRVAAATTSFQYITSQITEVNWRAVGPSVFEPIATAAAEVCDAVESLDVSSPVCIK